MSCLVTEITASRLICAYYVLHILLFSLQQRKSFALFGGRRPAKETGGRSRNLLVLAQEYVEYHTQSFIKAVHQLDALLLRKYQRVSLVYEA